MISLYDHKSACFGCGACQTACPHGAITMEPDPEGFLYPVVNGDLCVDCGLCKEICPAKETDGISPDFGMAFLGTDSQASSSGGAFPALVRAFWQRHPGAPVWGACLTETLAVAHTCATTPEELPVLQGSKYVQSHLGDAYTQVLTQLKQGLPVLFSGTPCQCAGLARLVDEADRKRLLLVDLVCNGTASPLAWKKYLAMEAEKQGAPVTAYAFRSKRYYMGRGISCTFADGSVVHRAHPEDLFSACYQRNLISRSSCYHCPYTCPERVTDLTLGDFHGLEQVDPGFSSCGASLVLPHTRTGREYCEGLENAGKTGKFPVEQCLQPRLESPPKEPPLRKFVLRDLLTQPSRMFLMKYQKLLLADLPPSGEPK